jgi:hypothetical protein
MCKSLGALIAAALVVLVSLNVSHPATAAVITFDTLSSFVPVPDGYASLNWSGWFALNVPDYPYTSGYQNGLISSPNIIYQEDSCCDSINGPGKFSSTTPFTLNSFYVTAAWKNDLQVTVTGLLNGVVEDTATLSISTAAATLEVFNWSNINAVGLSASGGTYAGYTCGAAQCGNQGPNLDDEVALDNLTITAATPLPPTWTVMLLGFVGLGVFAYRGTKTRSGFAAA